MNWVSENYKWLFDGVGGAATLALIVYLSKLFRGSPQPQLAGQRIVANLTAEHSSVVNSPVTCGSHNTQTVNAPVIHAQHVTFNHTIGAPRNDGVWPEKSPDIFATVPSVRGAAKPSKSEFLQHLSLKHALAINSDGFGRPVSWGSLSNAIREAILNLTDFELHDTLLFLYRRDYLILQKFHGDVPNLTLVKYHEFPVKSAFFNGEFRLLVSPEGRVYFEE